MRKILLSTFCCHVLALICLLHWTGYRFNHTDSMPHGIYRIVPGRPHRGDLVTFSLAETNPYFKISLERHYLGHDGNRPLLKILEGVPGDRLEITRTGIRINSELLVSTQAKRTDQHGRKLPVFLNSTIIPAAKCLTLSTYNANSFDGRYFGLVDMNRLQRVIPVLTFKLGG